MQNKKFNFKPLLNCIPPGSKVVGMYHTHLSKPYFSIDDFKAASSGKDKRKVPPLFLAASSTGSEIILKYDPMKDAVSTSTDKGKTWDDMKWDEFWDWAKEWE
jgi:proteasome lid subunit RPN8/RPN11